jgi:hypothetical protein
MNSELEFVSACISTGESFSWELGACALTKEELMAPSAPIADKKIRFKLASCFGMISARFSSEIYLRFYGIRIPKTCAASS